MSVHRGFELSGQTPMLPDHSVIWNVHSFPDVPGTLYAAPETGTAILEHTLNFATRNYSRTPELKHLGYGSYGTVGRRGDTAFKLAHVEGDTPDDFPEHDRTLGLSAVRASVMLHTGLDRLTESSPNEAVVYAAPHMLACFVSDDLTNGTSRTTWAMSYEKGRYLARWHRGAPDEPTQQARYNAAIEACGGDPRSVDFDMKRKNLLLSANMFGLVKKVVKLDVSARWAYDW